jgi:alginate O-acetyltransferase complex protein AlgI
VTSLLAGAGPELASPILFVELRFLGIFALIFLVHWAIRGHAGRKLWLLVASHCFYACFFIGDPLRFFANLSNGAFDELPLGWWFPALLWFSTVLDYRVGLGIEGARSQRARRAWLLASVAANLGILGFFKYYGFFEENVRALFGWFGLTPAWEPLRIFLPYGISFYTFQSLSYSIEVYRGRLPAERSFLNLALFVAFFPQLIAGPIVRAARFLPQTRVARVWSSVDVRGCTTLFFIGFVKKACVADGLAQVVDPYFAAPQLYDAASAWLALLCYAAQVYCDFSGYTDMATAVARLLGYELTVNFAFPYLSANVADFWRRWHISLSTWLRDYLYLSLGGLRASRLVVARNIMITMLLGGLWHGASWSFVAWGGMHGLALALHGEWARRFAARFRPQMRWLGVPLTFAFVLFSFVPFRAADLYVEAGSGKPLQAEGDGFYRPQNHDLRHPKAGLERDAATGDWHVRGDPDEVRVERLGGSFTATAMIWSQLLGLADEGPERVANGGLAILLTLLGAVHALNARQAFASWWRVIPGWSYAALLGIGTGLALFLRPPVYQPFIYFQF